MVIPDKFTAAYNQYVTAVSDTDNRAIHRTQAYNYSNDTSNITSRNSRNYSPSCSNLSEQQQEQIIFDCMDAYENEPIVRNIIDLMSDFGSQGARIICSDKQQEKFGQEWAGYIGFSERCERFLNYLYKCGTVIPKRTDGKVPVKVQKKWKSAVAGKEEIRIQEFDNGKAVIPLKWTFYDPRQIVMVGGSLANFVGKPIFALRINEQLRSEIYQLNKVTETQQELVQFKELIPDYVWKAINERAMFFPLDQTKINAYYYKKDDWEQWGKPLIRPILKDLTTLNKLKSCDNAALDGAMSAVRLWKLGSIKDGIVAQKPGLDKLRSILAEIRPGGVTDIVWGDDLQFQESNSNLHLWLGSEKYSATLSSIYAGLGVPPGMTGSSGSSSFTNNNISLKTLIERLKYGRIILLQFLNEQLAIVQKAMGFTKKFEVIFDQMVLSDEAAEKNLLLQLYDRNLITGEMVRFAFDVDHSDIEQVKINREHKKQGKTLPPKAGQFHNPDKEHDLKKMAIQKGGVTPSQMGMDLPEKKPGEKTFFESSTPKDKMLKPKGSTLNGRPKGGKDKTKRKAKRVLPRGSSAEFKDLFLFAETAQSKVEEIINPVFISIANKKNIRSLSNDETQRLESLKLRIFSNIQPYSDVNEQTIGEIAQSNVDLDQEFYSTYRNNEYILTQKYGRELTIAEKRNLMCESFAEIFSE